MGKQARMSTAEKQATVNLLGVVAAMVALRDMRSYSRTDMQRLVEETFEETRTASQLWTGPVVDSRDVEHLHNHLNSWETRLVDNDLKLDKAASITSFALQVVDDLILRTNNKRKREALESIFLKLQKLNDFWDSKNQNFLAMEAAGKAIDPMRSVIGWREES